ncbi:MAG: hypothetical protein WA628_10375, partial [Terriglobales bacterium]
MSTPALNPALFEGLQSRRRQLYLTLALPVLVLTPFLVSPSLRQFLLASNFLPHLYCYLRNPVLVWTHVVADT